MKARIPYLIAGLSLICFIILGAFMIKKNQERPIVKIFSQYLSEDGSEFINDSVVSVILSKHMDLDSLIIKNVDVDSIEGWLSDNSFVKKVDVYKTPKGELITEIIQKRPIIRVNDGREEYYITENYERIPLSDIYSVNALIVSGEIDLIEYKYIVDLVKYINNDNLLKNIITGVKKIKKNSFILKINKGSFDIEFGGLDNFEEKFTKLKLFYNQYLVKIGFNKYNKINLQYKNQIVAEKK